VKPQRVAVAGDDLPVAIAAVKRAGLQLVQRDPQAVLCHGGDGTLLRAEREWPGVPKVPARIASRARLCPDHQLEAVLRRLLDGALPREELPLLVAQVGAWRLEALNDIVLRNDNAATAVRLVARTAAGESGEITGDGVVCATPFGSTGYFRSVTRSIVEDGFGVAFSNSTEPVEPVRLAPGESVEIEIRRGPAELVRDNDPRSVNLRDGSRVRIALGNRTAVVLGLDALGCQRCRKADGSSFNPH
jgi:NAD+ kinase